MIAVIYARYSSHAQNDASIEQQVGECEQYAAAHGLKIAGVYADRALSGRSDRRPEFQRMLRAAERREFEAVLAYKSSRISRNMLHALQYEEKLSKYGISIVYCREEFGDNATGRFALRMMMSMNQFYSENMAEDITRGMLDAAQQCKVIGALPIGYKAGKDGRIEIDEAAAPVVREIFQRIANGEQKSRIAADLNARGIRTARGNKWDKGSFHRILENEKYIGVYSYKDVRIEGGVPAIVSADLFAAARAADGGSALKGRKRGDNVEYGLTGKLYCGQCRAMMTGSSGTGKAGKKYYYYRCSGGCGLKAVRKDEIERLVADALKACVTTDENIEWMVELVMRFRGEMARNSQLNYLNERLTDIKTRLGNLTHAIEMGVINETTQARMVELEGEQREVLAEIRREKAAIPEITADHVRFYFEQFRGGDVDDPKFRRMLVQHFLRAAYLHEDHLDIVFAYCDPGDMGTPVPIGGADVPKEDGVCVRRVWWPNVNTARTPATLRMVGGAFALRVER